MPKPLPLPLDKALYLNVDGEALSGSDLAAVLKNLLVDEAGANVDRPALQNHGELASITVIGGFHDAEISDLAIFVTADRKIYSIDDDGTVVNITGAAILGGTLRPVFDSDGTYIAIAAGGLPQRWNGTGNCELMPGTPPEADSIAFVDGYWILLEEGTNKHYFAGPTADGREIWGPSNYFSKEGSAGDSKAQLVIDREIWIVGPKGYETWQNLGSSPVPFARSFAHKRGIIAPYTLIEADNTTWWLDDKRRFVQLQGRTPVERSKALRRVIKAESFVVSDAWASRIDIGGFQLILLAFPTEERIFVLDYSSPPGEEKWYEWNGYRDGQEIYSPAHCHVFVEAWNKHLVGGVYNGVISELTFDAKSDGDDVLRRIRESGWYDHGTGGMKRSRAYLFHVKRGLGTPGGVEPFFEVSVNDDGQGWTNPVQVGLGFPGDLKDPIRISELGGLYKKRKLRIVMTDAVEFELVRVEEEVEPCK